VLLRCTGGNKKGRSAASELLDTEFQPVAILPILTQGV
jgi:hypothetical protein